MKVFTTKEDFLSETEQCFHRPYFVAVSKDSSHWLSLITDYEKNYVYHFD